MSREMAGKLYTARLPGHFVSERPRTAVARFIASPDKRCLVDVECGDDELNSPSIWMEGIVFRTATSL